MHFFSWYGGSEGFKLLISEFSFRLKLCFNPFLKMSLKVSDEALGLVVIRLDVLDIFHFENAAIVID